MKGDLTMKPNFSYINRRGKKVSGTASVLHHVFTECGGLQEYNDEVGKEYISAFLEAESNKINERLEKKAKKSRLKVIA